MFKPYWVLIIVTIYVPVEDIVFKWMPLSETVYGYTRFAGEVALYALLTVIILDRLYRRIPLKRTPIDIPLLMFVLAGLLSIMVNGTPLLSGLIGLRTLLRYVALFYIIVNLPITQWQARRMVLLILVIASLESIIGILQHFYGIAGIWLPRETDLEIAGIKKVFQVLKGRIEVGSIIGTFGHTINMALYLLCAAIVFAASLAVRNDINGMRKVTFYVGYVLVNIAILLTYSRGTILAAIITVPIILYLLRKKKSLFRFAMISFAVVALSISIAVLSDAKFSSAYKHAHREYVNPIENLMMLFSSEYLETTEGTRQWLLKDIGGAVLRSGTLIGFGPDETTTKERILRLPGNAVSRIRTYQAFEDVYWVALLAYYGIIGLSLFSWMLIRIFRCSVAVVRRSGDEMAAVIATSSAALLILIIPLTFIVRTFEFRAFAFVFWMLAGLSMNAFHDLVIVTRTKEQEEMPLP